jgi:hypothetical protein
MEDREMGFVITRGEGFQLTLENGWTVSVQFGAGNYASNGDTAEIAAWWGEQRDYRNWYDFGNDRVKGWVTADEVVKFLGMVSRLPNRIGWESSTRGA